MKLKFYATSHYYDRGRQCTAVVAAPSKKRAAELFKMSMYTFNNYVSETGNTEQIEAASKDIETVVIMEVL